MSRIEEALRRAGEEGPIDALDDVSVPVDIIGPPAVAALPEETPAAEPLMADGFASRQADGRLVVSGSIAPAAVEQYRRLAATLHKVHVERGTRVVMISSTMAGEGKTLTASNLALTLAESFGRRVLLVDADLRRPTVHEVFRIPNTDGLNACLGADQPDTLPLAMVSPRLTVLTAGRPNPDPMGVLTSDRMRRIITDAAANFEWVILDTPPLGLLPDANLLTDMVDMLVLVIGASKTPLPLIERTVKAMDREKLIGVVLNRAAESSVSYQYYQYYAGSKQN